MAISYKAGKKNLAVLNIPEKSKADFEDKVVKTESVYEELKADAIATWVALRNCTTRGIREANEALVAASAARDVALEIGGDFVQFEQADVIEKVAAGIELMKDASTFAEKSSEASDEIDDIHRIVLSMLGVIQKFSNDVQNVDFQDLAGDVYDEIEEQLRSKGRSAMMKCCKPCNSRKEEEDEEEEEEYEVRDRSLVSREWLQWPQQDIDEFKGSVQQFKACCEQEVALLAQIPSLLEQSGTCIKNLYSRLEAEMADVTQPFNVWDVLSLGMIRVKDGYDVANMFLGSFMDFKNLYTAMDQYVNTLLAGAQKILDSLLNLWKEFVELGRALCSFIGIEPPDDFDDEDVLDIDFDVTSKAFLSSWQQKFANMCC